MIYLLRFKEFIYVFQYTHRIDFFVNVANASHEYFNSDKRTMMARGPAVF